MAQGDCRSVVNTTAFLVVFDEQIRRIEVTGGSIVGVTVTAKKGLEAPLNQLKLRMIGKKRDDPRTGTPEGELAIEIIAESLTDTRRLMVPVRGIVSWETDGESGVDAGCFRMFFAEEFTVELHGLTEQRVGCN